MNNASDNAEGTPTNTRRLDTAMVLMVASNTTIQRKTTSYNKELLCSTYSTAEYPPFVAPEHASQVPSSAPQDI